MRFDGKRVLVTGAGRGIGAAIAAAFAAAGARVGVHYRQDVSSARAVAQALAGSGHALFPADVTNPEACASLLRSMEQELGGLDVLVNNAGVFDPQPLETLDYAAWQATWRHTLAVNLVGPANLCFLAARLMARGGGGRIVNVSSRGAFRGEPNAPAYGASKAGLNALTQSLAQALAPRGIFVAAVAPGFVETDMARSVLEGPRGEAVRRQSPLGRVARPEEVAHAVLFLASAGAEFCTGTIIDVNGASYLRT